MSIAHSLKTLLRNLKLGLRARHVPKTARSYTTPAQINAFADAFFDRVAYSNGDAPEMWLVEPGLKTKDIGHLDLTQDARVSWAVLASASTGHTTLVERRKGSRYRTGE